MPRQRILDSHVHLWPAETCNEEGHAWMTSGNPLAKPHLIEHYVKASKQDEADSPEVEVEGIVYVETDVRYDDPASGAEIVSWAKGPLDEITFLRTIIESKYGAKAKELLCGIVPWAPMDKPTSVLRQYLSLVSERLGLSHPAALGHVVGFRYLLQFITDPQAFEKLVFGKNFIGNLRILGERGVVFEVGVDQRSGGTFQLELVAKAMQKAHEGVPDHQKVVFVVNHLCKPAFQDTGKAFEAWCDAIGSMSKMSKTYMKLSGAFSELPPGIGSDPDKIAKFMEPWIAHVMKCFGPERIMFGSDWPVCNVGGPAGEESWVAWRDVIQAVVAKHSYGLSETEQDLIWQGTAKKAYRIDTKSIR